MPSYERPDIHKRDEAHRPPIVVRASRRKGVPSQEDGEPRHTFHAWRETLAQLEKEFLRTALERHGGNVSRTARSLGIHRSTLQRLMRRHNLPAA